MSLRREGWQYRWAGEARVNIEFAKLESPCDIMQTTVHMLPVLYVQYQKIEVKFSARYSL